MKLPKHRRDEAALNSRLIRRPIKRMVWLFLLPTFAAFCIGFLYPFFKGLFLSFCKFRITSQWTWTGLENYRKAFQDPGYMHVFWYTALFALVSLIAINLFAFTIAYALTQKFKGTNVFRTVFFLPNLIGGIVLGYIWSMIFDGILIKYNTSVVLETKYGFWGLVILVCWQQIGYMMIIYIAGLQAVPEDMLEAARIDGANRWQQIWHITLPTIRPIVVMLLVLSLGSVLSAGMEQIMLLYNPMVYKSSDIIDTLVYRLGLVNHQWSLSTAVGMMKSVVSFILVVISYRIASKHFDYQVF